MVCGEAARFVAYVTVWLPIVEARSRTPRRTLIVGPGDRRRTFWTEGHGNGSFYGQPGVPKPGHTDQTISSHISGPTCGGILKVQLAPHTGQVN